MGTKTLTLTDNYDFYLDYNSAVPCCGAPTVLKYDASTFLYLHRDFGITDPKMHAKRMSGFEWNPRVHQGIRYGNVVSFKLRLRVQDNAAADANHTIEVALFEYVPSGELDQFKLYASIMVDLKKPWLVVGSANATDVPSVGNDFDIDLDATALSAYITHPSWFALGIDIHPPLTGDPEYYSNFKFDSINTVGGVPPKVIIEYYPARVYGG